MHISFYEFQLKTVGSIFMAVQRHVGIHLTLKLTLPVTPTAVCNMPRWKTYRRGHKTDTKMRIPSVNPSSILYSKTEMTKHC